MFALTPTSAWRGAQAPSSQSIDTYVVRKHAGSHNFAFLTTRDQRACDRTLTRLRIVLSSPSSSCFQSSTVLSLALCRSLKGLSCRPGPLSFSSTKENLQRRSAVSIASALHSSVGCAWRSQREDQRCLRRDSTRPSAAMPSSSSSSSTSDGSKVGCDGEEDCFQEQDGSVIVRDDLDVLLQVLPEDIRAPLACHPRRAELLEVVLDLGRKPEARFLGHRGGECLREAPITKEDIAHAEAALGDFGGDNRAGVEGTLHRISAIRNRRGSVVGLTCRVGRAVTGHIDMIRDILEVPNSILFLGRPGVGKTTVIREMARVLSDDLRKRVVIVDTSNEIGGDGDVPHPAIGGARRMQVPDPSQQHRVMIEAVENHMPEIVIVDEIGTEAEALAW